MMARVARKFALVDSPAALPAVVVLGYHDLALPGHVHSWLQVDTRRFERQLRLCKSLGDFIHPDDLASPRRRTHRLNFLLTFDDGFVNSFYLGLPLLRKYSIPALFFISTHHLLSGEPFWFEQVIATIQRLRLGALDLRVLGMGFYRFARTDGEGRWRSLQALLDDIKRHAKGNEDALARKVVEIARMEIGMGHGESLGSRPLSVREIGAMHASGLCRFGSHGHRHHILTGLADSELEENLKGSRRILESLLQTSVTAIGYPNGDANERVRQACRLAGYRYGYTVNNGRLGAATEPMSIPRLLVGGYDSTLLFVRKLAGAVLAREARPTTPQARGLVEGERA